MFRGRFEHTVDEKGRTSLPARFREVLAGLGETRLVITTALDRNLVAYPLRDWEAFEERLSQVSSIDPHLGALKRLYLSGAVECDLDKLGRIQLTADLRQHAQLSREVVWAGLGKSIELWDKARLTAINERLLGDEAQRASLSQSLKELGL